MSFRSVRGSGSSTGARMSSSCAMAASAASAASESDLLHAAAAAPTPSVGSSFLAAANWIASTTEDGSNIHGAKSP